MYLSKVEKKALWYGSQGHFSAINNSHREPTRNFGRSGKRRGNLWWPRQLLREKKT